MLAYIGLAEKCILQRIPSTRVRCVVSTGAKAAARCPRATQLPAGRGSVRVLAAAHAYRDGMILCENCGALPVTRYRSLACFVDNPGSANF